MRTAWCTVFKMCGSICSQLVSSPFSACDSTFTLSGKRTCLQRNCSYKHAAGLTEMCLFLWVFSFNKELHRRGRRKVIWTSARSDNSCSEIASFLSLADFQQAIKKKNLIKWWQYMQTLKCSLCMTPFFGRQCRLQHSFNQLNFSYDLLLLLDPKRATFA